MRPSSHYTARAILIGGLLLAPILSGCHGSTSARYFPGGTPEIDQIQKGVASWYGPGFDGKQTASGERFSMKQLTAAHKTLPFGTVVSVTNLQNGRTVEVRINDRGPFVRGRIIDLSRRAAEQLNMIRAGVVPVEVRVLRLGPS